MPYKAAAESGYIRRICIENDTLRASYHACTAANAAGYSMPHPAISCSRRGRRGSEPLITVIFAADRRFRKRRGAALNKNDGRPEQASDTYSSSH